MKIPYIVLRLSAAMKHTLLFIVLTCVMPCAAQNDNPSYLVVHLRTGGRLHFPLTDVPRITLSNGVITVSTEHLLISNVSKYTFSDNAETGIDDAVQSGDASFTADPVNRKVYLTGVDSQTPIHVYTLDGTELHVPVRRGADGGVTIDLHQQERRIYLLSVGSETIKIQMQ